jgi:hypothetical protein
MIGLAQALAGVVEEAGSTISSDTPFFFASRALCNRCAAGAKRRSKKSTNVGFAASA